jgi:hypothetical protein
MSLVDAVEQIAQVITDATGIRTVADPRKVVLPCALVGPPDIEFTTNCGGMAEFPISLMAPGPWNMDALAQLSQMLSDVLAVQGIVPPESAKPGQMDTPDNGSVPVYRLVYRMVVEI